MSQPVEIVLVEDDINQSRLLARKILQICDSNGIEGKVTRYFSVHSFLNALRMKEFESPKFAIIDLMLHYYSANDLESIPTESEVGGNKEVKRAGLRCYDELKRRSPETKILLITVLKGKEIEGIPEAYSVANKGNHHDETLLANFLLSVE